MAAKQDWPADPQRVWAQTTQGQPIQRPTPPAINEFDDFCAHVPVPTYAFWAVFLMGLTSITAIWAGIRHLNEEPNVVFTILIAGIAIAGFLSGAALLVWDKVGRTGHLHRVHQRVLAHGITVHAFPTTLRMPNNSESGTTTDPAVLLIDARLPDRSAARLHTAFTTWCQPYKEDKNFKETAHRVLSGRRIVALTEIFGPEADGAWLVKDESEPTPWRLLVLYVRDNPARSDVMSLRA